MPKRTDINSILIIGAGPIVIGQACEFDYSGTQAVKALKEEGYRVVLVNSNPATIMTDPEIADATYVEPITPEVVAKILEQEKIDAVLPTMGGQTALNTALALDEDGTLNKLGVEMIGAKAHVIHKAEDRQLFRDAMDKIGLESPQSQVAHTMAEAEAALDKVGLPAIIRPSFTLAGTGGGIAYNKVEFEKIVSGGLKASPVSEVLIEESVLGWKEFEMEVVRDKADNCIIICAIENIDPMGIHTGDSVTVAPALTLTDKEYQVMRNASLAVLREIGVETGGSNVQFAVCPKTGRQLVIEMNPRVSRSSALASKATGFPIARVAAKLAIGYTLDELSNEITGGATPASFEPSIDYVVTKIPRFTFEKFPGAVPHLTSSMKSVGEVMAVGRNFTESVQKALSGLETGLTGFDDIMTDASEGALLSELSSPVPERLRLIAQAFRIGMDIDTVHNACKVDPWFLRQIQQIVGVEEDIKENGISDWLGVKQMGFSDARLAKLLGWSEEQITKARHVEGPRPVYKRIDSCAGEFPAATPYMYSTYENGGECESDPSDKQKVIILGGGPNRIGQGIEFDYCCVHASMSLRAAGYETIMVNCNPETVSTDFDTSDRLYFEPLTPEHVIELAKREASNGKLLGAIVQFGGQTPLRIAHKLEAAGIPLLGTTLDSIDLAEDRERFSKMIKKLNLLQPENDLARGVDEAVEKVKKIGFPVVIRPSYVLGGRAMEIVYTVDALIRYMAKAVDVSGDNPVLVDRYLENATEVDVDALCDGQHVHIAGIMEHIEEAGIHSGDSACTLPPYSLSDDIIEEIKTQTVMMAKELHVVGLMNVQFAIKGGKVYVIEVNPRASRTVPFVAKATGVQVAKVAARLMVGEKLHEFDLKGFDVPHMAAKEVVMPFSRFPQSDLLLGPEMRSTGEVMGIDIGFGRAFAKSQSGAGMDLPTSGLAFISVRDKDKPAVLPLAQELLEIGFKLVATAGTANFLEENGLHVQRIRKVREGQPHVVDAIINGDIDLVFNTTKGLAAVSDGTTIRHASMNYKVPYYTTTAAASASIKAIRALQERRLETRPLQSYYKDTSDIRKETAA